MEADYDDQNRVTEYRTYFNGEFVGRVNSTSQDPEQAQFVASAGTGEWVQTNANEEVTAVSWQQTTCEYEYQIECGGEEGAYLSETEPCEDDYSGLLAIPSG